VTKRRRRIGSQKLELLRKSREAALAAVQIFNNPNISFKSEIFIVLMIISWTYLLHAYYRQVRIDYRYFDIKNGRHSFHRTKKGAFKHWELERCLNESSCPIDRDASNNLRFLIGLRHEIEHQMTTRIDDYLSARFQATCINYSHYLKDLFGDEYSIEKHLSFSLQFSSLNAEHVKLLSETKDLPSNISRFIDGFDGAITEEEFNSPRFAYRVLFVAKTANHKGQADRVIEFLKPDSPLATQVNTQYAAIKEVERPKYRPKQIIQMLKKEGFTEFNMHHHTQLWQDKDAKNPAKGYGVDVAGTWYWYESWINFVKHHLKEHQVSTHKQDGLSS